MGKITPAPSGAQYGRVKKAKAKIKQLVGQGVKTNIQKASAYTVGQVAESKGHSQRKAASREVDVRYQFGKRHKNRP
ncbi:unnamed protein product [marine sediment metagenome]|uniref:Uncharacterized protein n=1 Tax=marine sediment metagenome TaxID=412755 RepID=X0SMJ6_9ZZZZ